MSRLFCFNRSLPDMAPSLEAAWMWGDVRSVSSRMARMNPLRWSLYRDLALTLRELEGCREEDRERPVLIKVRRAGSSSWQRQDQRRFPNVQAAIDGLRLLSREKAVDASSPAAASSQDDPSLLAGIDRPASSPSSRSEGANSPFRFEDRHRIPDGLIEGPFEDFEMAGDVYSTAYLIARNACPDMYSISPIMNPQIRICWLYFLFIVLSQIFVIVAITLWYPPSAHSVAEYVNCANQTSLHALRVQGFDVSLDRQECEEAGKFSFHADYQGKQVNYYTVEKSTHFYNAILTDGDVTVYVLRIVCCTWVFAQMYLQHFENVRTLLNYHDFSCWFVPLKNMEIRSNWVILIPLIQYAIVYIVTQVSFLIICAQREAFDIVMNSLAFTFIAEVGSYFHSPLSKRLAETCVQCLDKSYGDDIRYLYPEYAESNAVNEDGTYTDDGWYICEDEQKAGLLSDYKVRHNPAKYEHRTDGLIWILDALLCYMPICVVFLGAIRCRFFLQVSVASTVGADSAEL